MLYGYLIVGSPYGIMEKTIFEEIIMKNLNYLYNFKNPIRHFFNLDSIKFDNSETLKFSDLCWTTPVKFKVFKTEDSNRTISFPNILNFYHTIKTFEGEANFYSIGRMSPRKRASPDLEIGEFSAFSYYDSIKRDVFNLTKYDKLLLLDIKSFYGRIYTHDLGYNSSDSKRLEQRVGSLNNGRTNGLLLGSYLSLYLAELVLARIEALLEAELSLQNIDCHFEYFSDDFYFFCNNSDIDAITKAFAKVLAEYELELNYDKTEIFDFEEYTKNNNLEKLWKKIIKNSERVDEVAKTKREKTYPAFFTQLVYRLSQIEKLKYKRIFLANFFKTYYFNGIDPKLYILSESDFNHLCYIYKLMPETILYSLYKVKVMSGFKEEKFKDFLITRFKSSLATDKQEEQVYYYYAMKLCGFDEELKSFKKLVLKSKNQILISYFLIDKIVSKSEYRVFASAAQECEWLQHYHYLLSYDKENIDILIPSNAKKTAQKESYRNFYKTNLDNNITILKPIKDIANSVDNFVLTKIESYAEEKEKRGL